MTTSAIVLAGGRSSRFDGDKLEADVGGRSVLERTVEAVRAVADEVLVVGRAGGAAGVRFVADDRPFEGPLAGLAAGLRVSSGEIAIVVAGDMPLVRGEVLLRLVGRVRADDRVEAAALGLAGRRQPLPLVVRREAGVAAAVAALGAGGRSLRSLVDRLVVDELPEVAWRAVDPEGDTLFDIDTPADLERARVRCGSGSG